MDNVQLTPQQAAQEVIKLKKKYASGDNPNVQVDKNALNQRADFLRQTYNLDESKYGKGVSLADAYTNYAIDFGMNNNTQQTQQQGQYSNPQELQNFWQNTSNSFYDSQKAAFDKQLSEQLTNLQIAYNNAINEGKLSVNEAKEQFEEQKKGLEQQAYQQSKATQLYGNEMGIQNSQQMVGLQQGDNARFNSLQNDNVSARDKRINSIRDRINQITMEKDLKVADANSQYNYNLAGAKAQADQMYNQSMGQFMTEDYFTGRKEQHDFNVMDKTFDQNKELRYLDWGFKKEELDIVKEHTQENAKYASDLRINEMYTGHKLDLVKIDKQFENGIKELNIKYGLDSKLQSQSHINAMSQISTRVKAEAESADTEYQKAKERQALSLGLPAYATEWQITQEAKRQGREDKLQVERDARDAAIQDSFIMGITQYEINQILQNPDLELNPKMPKNYKKDGYFLDIPGSVLNKATGYKKDMKKYEEEEAKKQAALDAVERLKSKYK